MTLTRPRLQQILLLVLPAVVTALALPPTARANPWNSPYRDGETAKNTIFTTFSSEPTKLDPAQSYFSHEGDIIDQVYETAVTYHFLKRPYELIPLLAEEVPTPMCFDADGKPLGEDAPTSRVARVEYTVRIRPGVMYQPHPCFARDGDGKPLYRDVTDEQIEDYESPNDFPEKGTRELVARDFALQMRRLTDPRLSSPVLSTFERYVAGMTQLRETLEATLEEERQRRRDQAGIGYSDEKSERENPIRLDYMAPDLPGLVVIDDYTYKIVLTRKYPQILYWMAMHFFCPMPQEALDFYDQPAMIRKQFVIGRWPVGTGAYYLETFLPNEMIVLERNPNFRGEPYPSEGEPGDRELGFLKDAGKTVPFVDREILHLEKDSIPSWSKFLQGYYDTSGIAKEVFDQAVNLGVGGEPTLSKNMQERGISMLTAVDTSIFYFAFNMLDDVVGGYSEKQCKLRQAISIAMDYNEFLDIFLNARGIAAQGPVPPGVFGHLSGSEGANPYVDKWDPARERHVRKPIEVAQQLMAEAGYPQGRGPDGRPLALYLDHSAAGQPTFASQFEWYRRSLAKIGVELRDRGTDLRRMREKMDSGQVQLFALGWLADYPDPENFLFLFYGPNSAALGMGENKTNYQNEEFDRLFTRMESMTNSPERLEIVQKMVRILQHDAPWVWGYHPVLYGLNHRWYHNGKPNRMTKNTLKYRRVEPEVRVESQREWNRPRVLPVVIFLALLVIAVIPAAVTVYRRERGL